MGGKIRLQLRDDARDLADLLVLGGFELSYLDNFIEMEDLFEVCYP